MIVGRPHFLSLSICDTVEGCRHCMLKGPSTLATLFNHMWPRIVAGIFIPVGNHYFQALASTLQFVAQVCDRLWLVPATDRAFAYITYMSPPHVALVCSGPPQCAATCGWTKWPVCSGPYWGCDTCIFCVRMCRFLSNLDTIDVSFLVHSNFCSHYYARIYLMMI